MKSNKTVLVFGVFDRLHDGHRFFLREAANLGSRLVIIVARDAFVQSSKFHPPKEAEAARIGAISKEYPEAIIDLADETQSSWGVLQKYQPDIVALGYDQKALTEALRAYKEKSGQVFEIEILPDYQGNTLHSSLLS